MRHPPLRGFFYLKKETQQYNYITASAPCFFQCKTVEKIKMRPTIYHKVHVLNQFKFDPNSRTACVPISIFALYHLYESIEQRNELLNDDQWNVVMRSGVILWQIWKKNNTNLPTVYDILQLPQCEAFHRVFGKTPQEYGGLVRRSESLKNPTGACTLQSFLLKMVRACVQEHRKVCAIVVLPGSIAMSLLCRALNNEDYAIYLFDSHGSQGSDECEFVQFFDYRVTARHIIGKNQLESIDKVSQEYRTLYSEDELASYFTYSALLFIK
jgi:hypothetical protein